MRRGRLIGAVCALVMVVWPSTVRAQSRMARLDGAVEEARQAWLAHDVERLIGASDSIRLEVPDFSGASAIRNAQAAHVLERYFATVKEVGLDIREIRDVDSTHAFAEMDRRHAVEGTSDTEEETLFLGFISVNGNWQLSEIRVAP